ncbi:site-specific integrase [Metabacillus litoralis]|uniref:tyrosine-type recombinase/integrase n=1 Tax=Metabacillus litoralis TaxID=152268 RepID=UPI0020405DBF|nr:site-specific integrase [Metabacillus litoralis]MCM3160804.1 site-specific integrase [Metabacillus litoralis]
MKNMIEEIELYHSRSLYSENTKSIYKRRLDEFLDYLAKETGSLTEDVHLERIYERVNIRGETICFMRLDIELIEKYFMTHLDKSYNWFYFSRLALKSFFIYLSRKYDFPILIDEMNFNINDYKEPPSKKGKYVPTRHDLLKFLQSLIKLSPNLERDLLFFILLMSTGSRPSEVINSKVHDIDLISETIYRKKTKKKTSKYIILREGFGHVLERYIKKFDLKNDDYLINKNGRKMQFNELQEIFENYLKGANLPFSTLHKLRHSFATIMKESGAEYLLIKQLLGHKKIDSTKTYIEPNYIRNLGMEVQVNKEVYTHLRKLQPIKNRKKDIL